MGLPVSLKAIKAVAEEMLLRELSPNAPPPPPLGDCWTRRFMNRHQIKKVKQKPLEVARKEAHSPDSIRAWFEKFKHVYIEYDISRSNLWNFDETGFRIGVGGNE